MAKKKQDADYEKEDALTALAPGAEWTKRLVLDLPVWAIRALDVEATRRGIARQALIKNWLVDRLDALVENKV